jgi:Ferritin-like domain
MPSSSLTVLCRHTFITVSSVLEGVGTSAYLGAAPLVTSKAYLSVAGSILVTEALHTSMQRFVLGKVPMANPYGTVSRHTVDTTLATLTISAAFESQPCVHPGGLFHYGMPR